MFINYNNEAVGIQQIDQILQRYRRFPEFNVEIIIKNYNYNIIALLRMNELIYWDTKLYLNSFIVLNTFSISQWSDVHYIS